MPEGPSPRNLTEIELTPRAVAEREVALKLEQVELQRDILAIRKKDLEGAKKSRLGNIGISPLTTSVIAGLVGLIGTGVGAGAQGWFNRQLERDKFEFTKQIERQKNEANLILKLVETGNPEKAKTNLLFLVKAGFIQDTDGRIAALANDTATVPVLPKPSGTSSETVTIPLGTTLPDEQSYTVGEGDVYLEIFVGYAMFGKYRINLSDSEGKNPELIGEGQTGTDLPPEFKIGSGPKLAGKILSIQTILASPTAEPTTPVNVRYKLKGGTGDKVFNVKGTSVGSTIVHFLSIRLRAKD